REMSGGASRQHIVWRNVLLMGLLHAGALYSVFLVPSAHPFTWMWSYICFMITGLGVTAGAHRLWSHRSYKAKLPLRIFLAAANSMAFQVITFCPDNSPKTLIYKNSIIHFYSLQNDIFEWSRDHRAHHKYSETDADPHNARRGFFFSHVGWLFVPKHKDVIEKGKRLDMSDLLADPVVAFQRKYYKISVVMMCFFLPTLVPWYFWGESLWNSYFLSTILRYTIALNLTWLVNSAAHMYGNRPYNKNINPRENRFVTFGAIGEGFHNFHHTFPFDYAASEFGFRYNPTTCFIDLMCWFGLASNRKRATPEMIMARKLRTGDGS
ncbi:stearoyl-CoA desaturase 5, partial [Silurus meridionalis]